MSTNPSLMPLLHGIPGFKVKNRKLLGNALLLFTALIWGTAFAFQRVGMEKIEPLTFNAARMALAAVVIGIVAMFTGKKKGTASLGKSNDHNDKEKKSYKMNTITGGICCGIFLSFGSIFQQMGLVYTTAGKAGFITAMYMLLVPVIGFIFFKRKNTWLVWLAVVLGIIGMYFLCITEKLSFTKGDALVIVCAFFFSFHILCCDHFAPKGNPIAISAIQFATVTAISSVMALITEKPSIEKITSAFIPIVYCGIVSGGIGYTLQLVAQRFTEPATASLLMSMESVFAVLGGVVILNESMSVRELAGCIIMFLAIIMVQIPELFSKTT